MQAQYETAWSNAEATHAQGRQLLDSLTKVTSHRTDAACPGNLIRWCLKPLILQTDMLHIKIIYACWVMYRGECPACRYALP